MKSSSPMDPSTLQNPWQQASRSASQMRSTRTATINQHPLPGKDHHHQNSAETQTREVVLARLLSGHNRLNTHIHRKLKIVPSPTCPCGEEDQTIEHVLQRCNKTPTRGNHTVAISNSASPEIIWGLGGPEEDHQLHHCCWTGRVGEREEEDTLKLHYNAVIGVHGKKNAL